MVRSVAAQLIQYVIKSKQNSTAIILRLSKVTKTKKISPSLLNFKLQSDKFGRCRLTSLDSSAKVYTVVR
jgi:hypothetical protein